MKKNLGLKTAIIIASIVIFTVGVFLGPPSNWDSSTKAIKKDGLMAGLTNNIHLGLDLKGGTHLILQVMVDEAVASESDRAAERLKETLRERKVAFSDITRALDRPDRVVIKGVGINDVGTLRNVTGELFTDYDFSTGSETEFNLTMRPQALAALKESTVRRSIETIRGRVDQLGVTEPVIQEHGLGENQILVQLPGIDDPVRVRTIIQETGMLEIRLVLGGPYESEAQAQVAASGNNGVPMQAQTRDNINGQWYVLARSAVVSGEDIRSAVPSRRDIGGEKVDFTLKQDAGKRFGAFTEANLERPLSVVLSGKIKNVATIKAKITDSGEIYGLSAQEAQDLSKILESGALPASIKYLEDRTVGASLGAESIKQGVTAGIVGMALVMVFMLFYYHWSGVNANVGLILNLIILLGFLGFSGATLTLPGIAGVILTIGMGVDSNVLIFERIREELRAGKTPASAVDQGFARAWVTIIDTHITTIVSALILFLFGSGPVRGFAVTLAFGLFANLFTAVFVSRVIFDAILQKKQRGEALSI